MDAAFWHERWHNREIGFHESAPNRLFVQYLERLSLQKGQRVFLPLCGKTTDIGWCLSEGYRACGVELSRIAVDELFAELGVIPAIEVRGTLSRYSAGSLDIFVGDVFALSAAELGAVDAIYDRAALVALPENMRRRYAAHLRTITSCAPQLLICFEYDQDAMEGPPFSISPDEVAKLYGNDYLVTRLAEVDVEGGLKGQCAASEVAWLLRKR